MGGSGSKNCKNLLEESGRLLSSPDQEVARRRGPYPTTYENGLGKRQPRRHRGGTSPRLESRGKVENVFFPETSLILQSLRQQLETRRSRCQRADADVCLFREGFVSQSRHEGRKRRTRRLHQIQVE